MNMQVPPSQMTRDAAETLIDYQRGTAKEAEYKQLTAQFEAADGKTDQSLAAIGKSFMGIVTNRDRRANLQHIIGFLGATFAHAGIWGDRDDHKTRLDAFEKKHGIGKYAIADAPQQTQQPAQSAPKSKGFDMTSITG